MTTLNSQSTHEDVKNFVAHPLNQLRVLMAKHDFNPPLPIVRLPIGQANRSELNTFVEIRAVIRGENPEDVEARLALLVEDLEKDEIPGITYRSADLVNFRYIAIQVMVDDEVSLDNYISDNQVAAEIMGHPTKLAKVPGVGPDTPKLPRAGAVPLSGQPQDVQDRVAALLEQKKTATPDQARKIRQALRKLGHYISAQ